jgi:hypothetical protein
METNTALVDIIYELFSNFATIQKYRDKITREYSYRVTGMKAVSAYQLEFLYKNGFELVEIEDPLTLHLRKRKPNNAPLKET